MKPNQSAFEAVVVNVGTVHHCQDIHENQVTVLDPVPSCCSRSVILSPAAIFERASVRFPPRVTEWSVDVFLLNVIVAQSVSAVIVPLILAIEGIVSVLFVRVSVPARVAKSPSVIAVLNCAVVPVIPTIDV